MAWTQADLDAINSAIASGELRVRSSIGEVQYRSMDELLQAKAMITSELAGSSQTVRSTYAQFSKG